MKPNILFLIHLPPPIHGAATMGQLIKENNYINSAYNCTYLNLSTSKGLNESGRYFTKMSSVIKLSLKVLKLLFKTHYTVCYVTLNSKGIAFYKDLVLVLILKLFKCNIVYHFHNKGVAEFQNKAFDDILYRLAFRKVHVILLSKYLYCDVQKYVPTSRVYFCPNGIPENDKVSSSPYKEKEVINFLFLSNMMKSKGVIDLLQSCVILKNKGYNFICNFVGKWSDINENEFESVVDTLHLKNYVVHHGPKYGNDKKKYFLNSDIFIFPSHNEAFSLVIIEAMQNSVPVISTFEGGIPEIIDNGITGLLVKKQNPEDLANKIELLMNNEVLRKKLGKAGYVKYKKNYTSEIFQERFTSIINQIVNKSIKNN